MRNRENGGTVPNTGNTAVQVKISQDALAPSNDTCAGAQTIPAGITPHNRLILGRPQGG